MKEKDLKECNGDVWEDLTKLWTLSPLNYDGLFISLSKNGLLRGVFIHGSG